MSTHVEFCASCGAPLEARWAEIVVVCTYCGCQNAPGPKGQPVPSSVPDDGRPRFALAGRTYLIEGLLGQGDACAVYRGRWVRRLGELVVIKVLRSLGDADLLRREFEVLEELHRSEAQGAEHFVTRLPQPIALAPIQLGGEERLVGVLRWPAGFQYTLEQVRAFHGEGVEGRIAVWILKRMLEVLGWLHGAGRVHGAVIPPHVLVHPRDHGALLIGYGLSTRHEAGRQEALPALPKEWTSCYPDEVLSERFASPSSDLAMAARCALYAAGAETTGQTGNLPGALGRLVVSASQGLHEDAWELRAAVDRAAADAFGPPRYNPLPMPGW